MTTYLLVPGMNHGGWWWEPLVEKLEIQGHTVVAITPLGLDPVADPPREAINLDDHVAQAVAALRRVPVESGVGGGRDTVLVGHSYGEASSAGWPMPSLTESVHWFISTLSSPRTATPVGR